MVLDELHGEQVLVLDSITELPEDPPLRVVVCGSHGGLFPGRYAAHRQVAAVIFNDAGIGRDGAGVAGVAMLEQIGVAAAAVDHRSARIGDGRDTVRRGRLSIVNRQGVLGGWRVGMAVADAIRRRPPAPQAPYDVPLALAESRHLLVPGAVQVWALDSASLSREEDAGAVIVTGSHGGLLGGRREAALRGAALAALFNDAGGGIDDAGMARLEALADRAIPAATVSAASARIGDGRSTYHDGVLSTVNATAREHGATPGMSARAFAALFGVGEEGAA
jgi:hypothetical protein